MTRARLAHVAFDDTDLTHLATLARLELGDVERGPLRADLSRLVAYLAQLQEVDVEGVAAMHRPLDEASRDDTARQLPGTRADVIDERRALAPDVLEALAPATQGGRVRVARTVDESG